MASDLIRGWTSVRVKKRVKRHQEQALTTASLQCGSNCARRLNFSLFPIPDCLSAISGPVLCCGEYDAPEHRDEFSSPIRPRKTDRTGVQGGQDHRRATRSDHRLHHRRLFAGRRLPRCRPRQPAATVRIAVGHHQEKMPRGLESRKTRRRGVLERVLIRPAENFYQPRC
jgi:hypothetical protein